MSAATRRPWLLVLVLVTAACDKGDSLVVVSLDATSALSGITRFGVSATVGATARTFDVTPATAIAIPPSFDFGVRVPRSLGGSLSLTITAYAGTTLLASVEGTIDLVAGKRANLPLVFGAIKTDGGTVDQSITDLTPVDLLPPPGSDLTVGPDLLIPCDESMCAPCTSCGSSGTCSALVISADDDTGATCNGSNTCSATAVCRIRQGFACNESAPEECATGNCVDGVCCDSTAAMCGECKQCNKLGSEGMCVDATDGTDPDSECGNYTCVGGGCKFSCTCPDDATGDTPCNNAFDGYTGSIAPTLDCKLGYYCAGTGFACVPKRCSGSCGRNLECASNNCPYPSLMCPSCS